MLRRLFAALMAILLVGSSNNLVGAKGEIKMMYYQNTAVLHNSPLTEAAIFEQTQKQFEDLAFDISWCGLKMDPHHPEGMVKASSKVTFLGTTLTCVLSGSHLMLNENLPDREVKRLSKDRFDRFVEKLKQEAALVETTPIQVEIEVVSEPLGDNYKMLVCQWIDGICKDQNFNNPALIKAMVQCESSFNPKSISKYGCEGLMQITPEYFHDRMAKYAVHDLCEDPYGNLQVGIDWVKALVEKYNGDLGKVLVAYNCGESVVDNKGITSSGYSEKILRIVGDYM